MAIVDRRSYAQRQWIQHVHENKHLLTGPLGEQILARWAPQLLPASSPLAHKPETPATLETTPAIKVPPSAMHELAAAVVQLASELKKRL